MAPNTTGRNLIQVVTALRNFGVGANVRRSTWTQPGCFWTITRVKLNPNDPYKYGKAWGQFFWNHKAIGNETSIGGVAKRQWLLDAEQTLEGDLMRTLGNVRLDEPHSTGGPDEAADEAAA